MFHLEQAKAFVVSVEQGSFSAAARAIGKSHNTVSVSVNNLEIELGVVLFDRSGNKPKLTPVGEQLYQQFRLLLRQSERIYGFAESKLSHTEEQIRIGIGELIPFGYVEKHLAEMAKRFPHTQLRVIRDRSDKLQQLAEQGDIELMIQCRREAQAPVLDFIDLAPLEWFCACSPDSPLADMPVVDTETLLLSRQINCEAMQENPLLEMRSKFSNEIWLASDQQDVASLVEQDMGWAFLPLLLIEERAGNGALTTFTPHFNQSKTPFITEVDLLTHPSRPVGPAQAWLQESLLGQQSSANSSK
ncbi:LysR family transcriptional regulator [Paraferrimonas sedimenticola]|uniref:LysR family transcriptional regulator n=1 Tax=Paraferrimonas sedimenticola TaxID=375674 RepID=A0AA37RWH7_9GAMM|nr:LysR family transcriptional regulator [Paraferrimonas sedimenticola]GLP96052.1 LysR family transcriptional regulator [Paraferrimonas sedimenticola]